MQEAVVPGGAEAQMGREAPAWPKLHWMAGRFLLAPGDRRRASDAVGRRAVRAPFLLHSLVGLAMRRLPCDARCDCGGACRPECACRSLMAPAAEKGAGPRGGFAAAAWVLDAPWALWRPAETLAFGLKLFGRAARAHPHVERAVGWCAGEGLEGYRVGQASWADGAVDLEERLGSEGRPREMRIVFESPVRLVRAGKPLDRVGFPDLARDVAFRVESWAVHQEGVACPPIWPAIEADVSRAVVGRSSQAWRDARRHSARQGRGVPAGGVVGEMVVTGASPRLAALVDLAAVCGVGKAATSGLGRVRISEGATQ